MNGLSLFSGIGGLDLGLERAGATVVGQVEIDPWCRRVLAKHWPDVPRHDDVRTCVDWWFSEDRPYVDLVFGGFPCQPISAAGRRRGTADERWLWPAFADVVRRLRPRYVVLENVPRILVPWRDDGAGWNRAPVEDVLGDLAACGYDAGWDCIPAAAVGAPHLRDRWFAIAHADSYFRRIQPVGLDRGGGQAVPGDDGTARLVADPPSNGRQPRRQGDPEEEPRGWEPHRGGIRPHALAHSSRRERNAAQPQGLAAARRRAAEPGERTRCDGTLGDWWATEPDVGRVADGVPARVDRLRGLGNAVVPQVAEHVGRILMSRAEVTA